MAASAPSPGGVEWEAFSPECVVALRAEGRPIFIDFTADWCLSCKVNERIALHTDAVRSAFRASGLAPYPSDPERAPEILPAVLTPGLVIEAVERAEGT